jgi:hypothetical protein
MLMEIYRHAVAGRDSQSRALEFDDSPDDSFDAAQRSPAVQINS